MGKKSKASTVIAIMLAMLMLTSAFGCSRNSKGDMPVREPYQNFSDSILAPEDAVGEYNTEEYGKLIENRFLSVASNPLSTFSADVDTASYANMRRMIRDGYGIGDIPTGAIRTEELLNYFDYDYEAPTQGEVFELSPQIAQTPWNPNTMLLVMGLQAANIYYNKRPASNLVFLIDVSGSMQSTDKLELLKASFNVLVESLNENDRVSIVTYSGRESVILDGASGNQTNKILNAIRGLRAGGSTNGESGLDMAYRLANEHYMDGGNNRIIMASDGDLNVGMSSTSELYDYVAAKTELGIYLSVLGFGTGNYSDSNMETLADNGNGNYYYIDCIDEAEKVLSEELLATLYTVADDVKLQIEFNPLYVSGYRLIGYENRVLETEDFEDDNKDAGEVGAGHSLTVMYEVIPAGTEYEYDGKKLKYQSAAQLSQEALTSGEWATLSIRYKKTGEDESVLREFPIKGHCVTETPNDDWKFAAALAELAMVLHNSDYLVNGGMEHICRVLDDMKFGSKYREEFSSLVYMLIENG